ncbi:MAG: sigma-70 family RNA polymerase sigma factor [Bacteroidota bacterium]
MRSDTNAGKPSNKLSTTSPHTVQEETFSGFLQRAADGDREAFAVVYRQAWPNLFRALKVLLPTETDAEEMAQDIFVKLWLKKEILPQLRSLDNYLFRMAKNEIGMQARHKFTQNKVFAKLAELQTAEPQADEELIYKEYHAAATKAINQLTDKRKTIFLMRTQRDMTMEEIAAELGISASVVRKQFYTAIQSIKEYLRDNQAFPSLLLFSVFAEKFTDGLF